MCLKRNDYGGVMAKKKVKNEFLFFIIALVFMLAPIILWIVSIATNHQEYSSNLIISALEHVKIKNPKNSSPFSLELGIPSIMAVVLYTIVLMRNKDSYRQFGDINKIDVGAMILHLFNLIFLVSVCSLAAAGELIFGIKVSALLVFGIIISLLGMHSISGFVWIILSICFVINISLFNGWWGAMPYIICSYVSIFIQVAMLKYFQFDLETLKMEFTGFGNMIVNDTHQAIELSKEAGSKAVNIGKNVIPSGKIVDVISSDTKSDAKV